MDEIIFMEDLQRFQNPSSDVFDFLSGKSPGSGRVQEMIVQIPQNNGGWVGRLHGLVNQGSNELGRGLESFQYISLIL